MKYFSVMYDFSPFERSRSFSNLLITCAGLFLLSTASVSSHGLINFPNPRGCLSTQYKSIFNSVNESSVVDYKAHFPAGNKSIIDGAGKRSQQEAYNGSKWVPFSPFDPFFKWRAGVCGDPSDGKDHLRGGKYYNRGQIVAKFWRNQVINVSLSINVHHNGFMELFVCDVKKCGGDISPQCFLKRACRQLYRNNTKECETGSSRRCGPIDKSYPGRWYMPCPNAATIRNGVKTYGLDDGTIQYRLPYHLYCHHCVLLWYWTSANNCNPPGVREYFWGPHRPREWGDCSGQGKALGGFTRNRRCGKSFPEEYLMCSDITIREQRMPT